MSNIAVSPTAHWANPLSRPEVIDLDDALAPRCPRTKRTIADRDGEAQRHSTHRSIKERKELALQRRGKPELSEAQNRALFSGHPSVTPSSFLGYRLTKRQRAQVKLLKKLQSGGSPALESAHSRDAQTPPVKRRQPSGAVIVRISY